jgi:hypothetical protein
MKSSIVSHLTIVILIIGAPKCALLLRASDTSLDDYPAAIGQERIVGIRPLGMVGLKSCSPKQRAGA